jgi:hypothetical protein
MAKRKFRFDEGGDVMEAINASEDAMDIMRSMEAGPRNEEMPKADKPKERIVSKKELEDSGLTLREYLNRERGIKGKAEKAEPKSEPKKLRQETMNERAESFIAKRAARKAEEAAKDTKPRGQDRILTNIKKNAGENKFMGSTGMKSGGSVSSASRRADGIAAKGKTRCKMR